MLYKATCIFIMFSALSLQAEPLVNLDNLNQLTLEDAIAFGVRNNRNIKTAYLQRVSQKFELYVSQGKFLPKIIISSSYTQNTTDSIRSNSGNLDSIATISLPTGAVLTANTYNSNLYGKTTTFALIQPLLKNAGLDVNTASIRTSEIGEQVNQIALKATVSQTVVQIIYAYRELIRAQEQKKISEVALLRSQNLYETNKALISAGRMAKVEIIQTEADVANQEVALEGANNQIETSRMALLALLAIEPSTILLASSLPKIGLAKQQVVTEALDTALKNQPDYLISLLAIQSSKINLDYAKNQQLWDVSLVAGQTRTQVAGTLLPSVNGESISSNVLTSSYAGVQVAVPIGDRTIEQSLVNASVEANSKMLLAQDIKQALEQRVRIAVSNVQTRSRQLDLSKKAMELTQQKLELENEKLKAGRSSNFQILVFESDLRNAENAQLNAQIAYLNAVTDLDYQTGTTLDVWQIPLSDSINTTLNDY